MSVQADSSRPLCAKSGHSPTPIAAVENDCVNSNAGGSPCLDPGLGDGDRLLSRIPPQRLRGYAESPQERTTHAFAVRKTRFLRDHFNRVPPFLDHEPGSFQPKPFDGSCR